MVWSSEFLDLQDFVAKRALPLDEERMDLSRLDLERVCASLHTFHHQLDGQLLGIDFGNGTGGKFSPAWVIGGWQSHGEFLCYQTNRTRMNNQRFYAFLGVA
jgi:hypothetical protein